MPPAALARPAGPVAAAAAMAPIVPAVPSLAAFFKKSRLWSIASVHIKKPVAASTRVGVITPGSGPAGRAGLPESALSDSCEFVSIRGAPTKGGAEPHHHGALCSAGATCAAARATDLYRHGSWHGRLCCHRTVAHEYRPNRLFGRKNADWRRDRHLRASLPRGAHRRGPCALP